MRLKKITTISKNTRPLGKMSYDTWAQWTQYNPKKIMDIEFYTVVRFFPDNGTDRFVKAVHRS